MKSLNTKYAGCLFRSRLEARWAVYFNAAGVAWEYEPQGFEVTERLACSTDTFPYLPDFWLPEQQLWVEVKGSLTASEADRLINAAASLSVNAGDGCGIGKGHDLVVFGPLTSSGVTGVPIRLHMHKGDLIASCWLCATPCSSHTGISVANDTSWTIADLERILLRGYFCAAHLADARHLAALDTARTARFEHGAKPKAVRL